jgi:phosphoribosylformylglycinamidine cyclo-ligase
MVLAGTSTGPTRLGVSRAEMFKVFNMGIGFVLIVKPPYVDRVMRILKRRGEQPVIVGKIQRGKGKVRLK